MNPTDDELRERFPELAKAKFYRPVTIEAPDGPLSAEQLSRFLWEVEGAAERRSRSEFLLLVVPREEIERIDSRLSPNARKASSRGRSTKYWPKGETLAVVSGDRRSGQTLGFSGETDSPQ